MTTGIEPLVRVAVFEALSPNANRAGRGGARPTIASAVAYFQLCPVFTYLLSYLPLFDIRDDPLRGGAEPSVGIHDIVLAQD